MNPFPFMRYYVRDFEHDEHVSVMSALAVGAYHLLLWKAWHQSPPGTLPNDDAILAQWARLTPDEWARVRPEVDPCFKLSRGAAGTRLVQKRMVREYQAISTDRKQKSAAGRKAIRARWGTKKELHTDALRSNNDGNTNTEPDTDKNHHPNPPPPQPPPAAVVVEPAAAEPQTGSAGLLHALGVTPAVVAELAPGASADFVRQLTEYHRERLSRREITPAQLPGAVVSSIRQRWAPPARGAPTVPDVRQRAVAGEAAKAVAGRKAEAAQLAEAERVATERLRALPPEGLAALKDRALTTLPEGLRARLQDRDPLTSTVLRPLVLQLLEAG